MQNTSALYKQIIAADTHWFENKLVLNGVTYAEEDLFKIETSQQAVVGKPEIGKAISAEIDVHMVEPTVAIPKMAAMTPYFRACGLVSESETASIVNDIIVMTDATIVNDILTFDEDSGVYISQADILTWSGDHLVEKQSEWLPKGTFYIDTREHIDGASPTLRIHGYDAMAKAEADYPNTNHAWPYLDTSVVTEIAQTIGVTVDSRTWDFLTASYMIDLPVSYTMRETLEHIASTYCGNFVISAEGKLLFVPLFGFDPELDADYLADEDGNALTFGNEGWFILV